jgi:hypothetical protein
MEGAGGAVRGGVRLRPRGKAVPQGRPHPPAVVCNVPSGLRVWRWESCSSESLFNGALRGFPMTAPGHHIILRQSLNHDYKGSCIVYCKSCLYMCKIV